MSGVLDVVSGVLVVLGAVLGLTGALGLHRLGDTLSRMHSATKPATLGVLCCGVAAALQLDDAGAVTKVAVAVVLQLLTAPVGAHLLAREVHGQTDDPATESSEHG